MFLSVLLLLGGVSCSSASSPRYGFVTSPHFPKMYPTEKHITWNIAVPEGYNISLKFLAFSIELSEGCTRDFVTISEPRKARRTRTLGLPSQVWGDRKELGRFCGPMNSSSHPGHQRFVSEGNQMTIEFHSDSSKEMNNSTIRYFGFQAYYQAVAFGFENSEDLIKVAVCGNPARIDHGEVTFGLTLYQSEAKYSCKTDYYTLVGEETYHCSLDGLWVNSKDQSDPPTCKPVCGRTTLQLYSRIYGGSPAENGYFPWVVHFASGNTGGGSLISDQWVLTAASLVHDNLQPKLRAGDVLLRNAVELVAKKVIIHPRWITGDIENRQNFDNDIALVQLSRRIEMGPSISPVCLPEDVEDSSPDIDEVGYVAGWGKSSDDFKRAKNANLQYAPVSVRKTEDCKKSVVTDQVFTENMICAGGDGKDSCQGDSGGPLMFRYVSDEVKDTKLYLGGIVSWGLECGKFGMYTRVRNYLEWIKETIKEVEKEDVAVCGNPARIDHGEVKFGLTLYQSEAKYSCKTDYYTLVGEETYRCSLDGLWVNSKGQSDPPTCKPVCGMPSNPVTGHSRIINGAEAKAGNFPWQVLLLKNGRGGGILIGEHWVMTAAHVIRDKAGEANPDDANSLHVFIGDTDVDQLIKRSNLAVREVHVHPSYIPGYHDHDIALIRLKDPVTMDENTSPICLPGDGDESLYDAGTVGYVSGYGMTERNRISNLLKYVALPMVQRDRCQEHLKKKQSALPSSSKIKGVKFTENMFCAGFPEAEKRQQDSCQGDVGGPYASQNGDKWVATGIVSWGIGCGTGYDYYTKVSNYMDWIKGHLNS
ncbi:complement C1r-A subcomponent-like [Aquarana catesbeiana]|uniref:complement C1r-A subcomponent-like n=1 Tax=Aquarana catesbeiana TaxID=8400 RepID=UPI003CC9E62C